MQNNNQKKNYTDLFAGIVVMVLAAFFYWTTLGTKSFMKAGKGRLLAIVESAAGVRLMTKVINNTGF